MNRLLGILLFVFSANVFSAAQQQQPLFTENGNSFLAQCGNYEAAPATCTAYVGGVMDGRNSIDKPGFCLPDHVTYGQMVRVSIKYMQTHPESLHLPTTWLVILANAEAFPCPATKKP